MQRSHRLSIIVVAATAALAACEDDPARPAQVPSPTTADTTFQPLGAGHAWTYSASRALRYHDERGGDARPPQDLHATVVHEITAEEVIAGATWALEEERFTIDGARDPVVSWRRYRQDRTGLYRADLPTRLAPGGAADIDSLTEARRLAYPPSVGDAWLLHDDVPGETAATASFDTLATPAGTHPAFRVEYVLANDGPHDYRRFWYSRAGLLRSEVHTEIVAIDVSTGDTIRIESTEVWEITGIFRPAGLEDWAGKSPGAAVRTEARPASVRR